MLPVAVMTRGGDEAGTFSCQRRPGVSRVARVLSPVTRAATPCSRLPGGATTPTEVSPGDGQTVVTEATGTF